MAAETTRELRKINLLLEVSGMLIWEKYPKIFKESKFDSLQII